MIQLLTADQVAEVLVCSPATVRRLAREGKLASIQVGARLVRFTSETVEQYVEASFQAVRA